MSTFEEKFLSCLGGLCSFGGGGDGGDGGGGGSGNGRSKSKSSRPDIGPYGTPDVGRSDVKNGIASGPNYGEDYVNTGEGGSGKDIGHHPSIRREPSVKPTGLIVTKPCTREGNRVWVNGHSKRDIDGKEECDALCDVVGDASGKLMTKIIERTPAGKSLEKINKELPDIVGDAYGGAVKGVCETHCTVRHGF